MIFSSVLPQVSSSTATNIVCIDPGHGGDDPGAVNGELMEADVVLDIASRLQKLLEKDGYRVVMTRDANTKTLSNSERAEICNNYSAKLLISIHLNSNPDTNLNYTQGLFGSVIKDYMATEVLHRSLAESLGVTDEESTDFESNTMLKANMPATLQEVVFITSTEEYSLLSDGTGDRQQQIAQALYNGINEWFLKL